MFRRYRKYRHRSCLDIDIEVVKVCHVNSERTILRVKYVAQRNPMFYFWPVPVRVRITRDQYENWVQL